MEEIKVGEYVRTKRGIAKVTDLVCGQDAYFDTESIFELNDIDFYRNNGIDIHGSFFRDLVIDHSPNIIDLIEEGDYVNGKEILEIKQNVESGLRYLMYDYIPIQYYVERTDKIKSIVTKEQFNQMKYIVGDESSE